MTARYLSYVRAALPIACLVSVNVLAQEAGGLAPDNYNHGWAIGLNTEYSDNVYRAPDETKKDDTSVAGLLRFDFGATTPRWLVSARSDLEYRQYQHRDLNSELIGGFDGRAEFQAIRENLTFWAEDNYGQIRRDPTLPDSPTNREGFNVIGGGAEVHIPITTRLSFFADGSTSMAAYEGAEADYRRSEVDAGLRQALSETTSLFIRAERGRVTFSDAAAAVVAAEGYDIDEASLGFTAATARTILDVEVGRTVVHGAAESPKQLLFRGSLRRQVTARLALTLEAGTEYSDSTQTFVREQGTIPIGDSGVSSTVAVDPFKSDYAALRFDFDGSRYSVGGSVLWRRERHEVSTELDREFGYGELGITRRISGRVELYLRGSYDRSDVPATTTTMQGDVTEAHVRLGMSFRPWRRVLVETYGETYSGDAVGFDYRENRVGLSISYSPTPAAAF